jgi:hypothetical protein
LSISRDFTVDENPRIWSSDQPVLDGDDNGYVSDVIAALDHAIAVRDVYNIRVINLSVAPGVFESYNTDPPALAARRAVQAGIVVVAAAGNLGLNAADGRRRSAARGQRLAAHDDVGHARDKCRRPHVWGARGGDNIVWSTNTADQTLWQADQPADDRRRITGTH